MPALNGKPVELISIEADLREQKNLLEERRDVAEPLREELEAWLAEPRRRFGLVE